MQNAATSEKTKTWINAVDAGRRLDITPYRVRTHALAGRIRTRVLPGCPPQYNAEDVEKLIDSDVK